ncbi:hypothetical protein N7532_003552 [Penicillium argentinense]|uniref:Uncharacterized protein n=1 Tax=Penicillium argentinense TaxID=1131581 RepID=A0A9W9FMV0_9EURO|nr:uncharacterized protein N7532_003552 [Penicillium argentinense]KAJ5103023.1 hypothetical protein N7532_003552 [Penicillium argentinense]
MLYWYIWNPEEVKAGWKITVFNADHSEKQFRFADVHQLNLFVHLKKTGNKDLLLGAFPSMFEGKTHPIEIYDLLFKQSNKACWMGGLEYSTKDPGTTLEAEMESLGEFFINGLANPMEASRIWARFKLKSKHPDLKTSVELKKPRSVAAPQDVPEWVITWINNSANEALYMNQWYCYLDVALGTIIQQPDDVLNSKGGAQSLSWCQSFSTLAGGDTYGYIIWQWSEGDTNYVVGVQITAPFQMFGIGYAPYYQVTTDGATWSEPHYADKYTFQGLPLNIQVVPVAGHSTMTCDIQIKDPSNAA